MTIAQAKHHLHRATEWLHLDLEVDTILRWFERINAATCIGWSAWVAIVLLSNQGAMIEQRVFIYRFLLGGPALWMFLRFAVACVQMYSSFHWAAGGRYVVSFFSMTVTWALFAMYAVSYWPSQAVPTYAGWGCACVTLHLFLGRQRNAEIRQR